MWQIPCLIVFHLMLDEGLDEGQDLERRSMFSASYRSLDEAPSRHRLLIELFRPSWSGALS